VIDVMNDPVAEVQSIATGEHPNEGDSETYLYIANDGNYVVGAQTEQRKSLVGVTAVLEEKLRGIDNYDEFVKVLKTYNG